MTATPDPSEIDEVTARILDRIGGRQLSDDERQAMLERMGSALRDAAVDNVASKVSEKTPFDQDQFQEFFQSLAGESDRAVPILAWSFIETWIEILLIEELNPSIPGGLQRLTEWGAPLGTSGARIRVAQALYWLQDRTAADLRLLAKIRNLFAHEMSIAFDDERVRGLLSGHRGLADLWQAVVEGPGKRVTHADQEFVAVPILDGTEMAFVPTDNRTKFVAAAAISAFQVVIELTAAPAALRSGLSPSEFLSRPDKWPEWMEDGPKRTAVLVLRLLS